MNEVRPSGLSKGMIGRDTAGEKPSATVQLGESRLAEIASRLNVDIHALIEANPQIQDLNSLKPGQDVFLPQTPKPERVVEHREDAPAELAKGLSSSPAGDPMAKSLAQLRLNQLPSSRIPGADTAGQERNALFFNDGVTAQPAQGKSVKTPLSGKVPADVEIVLDKGIKTKGAETEFGDAQKAIAKGDYKAAYAALEKLLRKQGEEVMTESDVKATETVRDQLKFLSRLQDAGISASYPPTEAQLVEYFKTLAKKPDAARQAFKDYVNNFHVHPADVPGAKSDVGYSKDPKGGTAVPDDWSEVSNRAAGGGPQHTGKQMNDCEGYAFMAEKLLGAAGFKVAHHVTVHPTSLDASHSMVMFKHPNEKGVTVTSNNGVFTGDVPKAVAREGLQYAAGGETGKEKYYVGPTMTESQQETVRQDRQL